MQTVLYRTVSRQLVKMLARQLEYSPSADEIDLVSGVMTEDLYKLGYGDDDFAKVQEALEYWGMHNNRWPTTNDVRQTIVRIGNQKYMSRWGVKALPEPEEHKKKRIENGVQAIQALKNMVNSWPDPPRRKLSSMLYPSNITEEEKATVRKLEEELNERERKNTLS